MRHFQTFNLVVFSWMTVTFAQVQILGTFYDARSNYHPLYFSYLSVHFQHKPEPHSVFASFIASMTQQNFAACLCAKVKAHGVVTAAAAALMTSFEQASFA